MTYYLQVHKSQRAIGVSATTRRYGCTWTAGANGVAASTGGSKHPSPDQVHALLPSSGQENPSNPGWSLADLDKALSRIGVPFEVRSGSGWRAAIDALNSGHYIVLQGDSDQFSNATCSGAFDGDHAIGVHPKTKVENGVLWRWIDDPICLTGRWEREIVLQRYAADLHPRILFGVFTHVVPQVAAPKPPAPAVTLRYGARKLLRPTAKRIRVPAGRRANVRIAPRTSAKVATTLPRGSTFTAYQVTDKGQKLAGSSRWFGNRTGTRWVHSSSF